MGMEAARCCLLVCGTLSARLSRCPSLVSVRFLFLISCYECLEDRVTCRAFCHQGVCWWCLSPISISSTVRGAADSQALPQLHGFRMAPLHSLLVFSAFLHWAVYYDTIDGHMLKFSIRDVSEVRIFVVETGSHVAQASLEFSVAKDDLNF